MNIYIKNIIRFGGKVDKAGAGVGQSQHDQQQQHQQQQQYQHQTGGRD